MTSSGWNGNTGLFFRLLSAQLEEGSKNPLTRKMKRIRCGIEGVPSGTFPHNLVKVPRRSIRPSAGFPHGLYVLARFKKLCGGPGSFRSISSGLKRAVWRDGAQSVCSLLAITDTTPPCHVSPYSTHQADHLIEGNQSDRPSHYIICYIPEPVEITVSQTSRRERALTLWGWRTLPIPASMRENPIYRPLEYPP